MKLARKRRHPRLAFTIIELLVVVAILALMINLLMPALKTAILRAQSLKCAENLRSIGTAVNLAANDNNGQYPEINQTAPPLPYDTNVPGLVGVLGAYGIATNSVKCPVDLNNGGQSSFTIYGSSYEWRPAFDDEQVDAPLLYIRPGTAIPITSSRVRLCDDFTGVHSGKQNALYADGHVATH